MSRIAIAFALLAITPTVATDALQKPNFAGTWIIAAPSKGAGQEVIVKQDDKTLTLSAGGGRTMTHQLDGSERRQTIPMRGGDILRVSKAIWEGSTIVITTLTDYPNKMKTAEMEIWSIDSQGRLVIDFTESAEGQPGRVVKVIHTRKS